MNKPVDYSAYDEVLVQNVVDGRHPGGLIHAADAGEVVRRLAECGLSDGQIAHRLGFYRRSVHRIRMRLGIPTLMPLGSNGTVRFHDLPSKNR